MGFRKLLNPDPGRTRQAAHGNTTRRGAVVTARMGYRFLVSEAPERFLVKHQLVALHVKLLWVSSGGSMPPYGRAQLTPATGVHGKGQFDTTHVC